LKQTGVCAKKNLDLERIVDSRSTITTLNRVMNAVERAATGPLYKRELYAMVSLDLANAFNSASWVHIEQALVEKEIHLYLIHVLRSYLSDR